MTRARQSRYTLQQILGLKGHTTPLVAYLEGRPSTIGSKLLWASDKLVQTSFAHVPIISFIAPLRGGHNFILHCPIVPTNKGLLTELIFLTRYK